MTNSDFLAVLSKIADGLDTIQIKGLNNVRNMSRIIQYMQNVTKYIKQQEQQSQPDINQIQTQSE